jgi:FSR family fosmidomycin resistance protein-like MFS transporter
MALTGFLIFAPNFAAMYLLLLVAGVGSACFHPIAVSMANRVSGTQKGFGVSLFLAGGRLGVAAGAGMATFILARWGLDAIPLASVFGLGLGISLLFIAPRIKSAGASPPADLVRTLEALREVVRSMSMLWGINACRTASTVSVLTFIPIYIVSEGGSVVTGGRMVTFFLLAAALGGILGGYVSDRIGRRRVLIIGFATGLSSLTLVFLLPDPARTAFLMLAGAGLYTPLAVAVTYAQELLPGSAAFASSLILGVTWFMGSLGVVLVGVLADAVGIHIALPLGSLAYVVLGLVLSVILPEGPPKGEAAGEGEFIQR